ncbi:MAG: hypothetical protein US54_C0001G0053 [Candidatus Roizmanbacteria bacterium GW2011_GWA2_37_7]|uniref:Plasmid stabilization system n=1 Tax=Candidatus Roizmanbacteria bacterium GW2011_GWA2_37_7 TaxID=1618481 RepID=A0A0G0H6M9_9BACT|nr:MAG: hypothetical protein US54_C0001G0053 [Candidatus Roizmanbacteria bacterium GW2011_GWA2_37_7]
MRESKSVEYSNQFTKQLKKASIKIKKAFLRRRQLFIQNPQHPLLKNHSLVGELAGLSSFNVTGDWRAVFKEEINKITFVALGTHSQLYR